ncbi:MAG TPA: ribosome maturation factor RimP [Acidobacteriota bacterium]|nr:ribosome maturation factor RimP [Acidobacteriota bacterium]
MDLIQTGSLETEIGELAERVAASMNMEVVLVKIKGEGNRSVVRAYIDKPAGITLDDCEQFSKRLSVALDVEDLIPFSYILEVSSPGVDRPLVKEADFERFCGKNAKIRTKSAFEGRKTFRGRIMSVNAGRLTIEVAPGKQIGFALTDIEKASLIAELSMKPQGA